MAENSTIARPYAQAAFDIANAQSDLAGWSDMIALAAMVASDSNMAEAIDSPHVKDEDVVTLFLDVCGDKLTAEGQNFIRVLAENKRLGILADIAVAYEQFRADAEGTLDAEVISAFELTDAQQQNIIASLKKRLGRDISLTTRVDDTLIGGAIIRAGDMVIDGTVTRHLDDLTHSLMR